MNDMRSINIFCTNQDIKTTTPRNCPYCGLSTAEPKQGNLCMKYLHGDNGNGEAIVIVPMTTHCCDKTYIATYLFKGGGPLYQNTLTLLNTYPRAPQKNFDPYIQELSPRFVALYDQVQNALLSNDSDLAGTGLRNAMEILIRDYAIKELGKTEGEVKKERSLDAAIKAFLPGTGLDQAAYFIKEGGNEFTHYFKKYEPFDIQEMNYYLDLIVNELVKIHRLANPPMPEKLQ